MQGIYISPSTQERNIGVAGYGTEEQRMNELADFLIPLLEYNAIETYRNRPTMTHIECKEESNNLFDEGKVQFHLAIHTDAGGGKGTTAFTSGTKGGYQFTKAIYDHVAQLVPSADRGIKVTTDLTEVVKTKAYACLLEVAFHDDTEDVAFVLGNLRRIAIEICKGVCEALGIAYQEPIEYSQPRYTVQVGAYRVLDNAKQMEAKLKALGFPTYLKKL